ncbi:hypothetical protein [Halomarina oriensis]|uniref:Uncharacterized protein n=1 Tax=Halomarina oriensis TaxID=671145 RepID=A0A6B0GMY1_9EURY|nr:hypothetical protein [Halomarina oriensis]MWG34987.1 hypothetical protein [Halomarina oriensis]
MAVGPRDASSLDQQFRPTVRASVRDSWRALVRYLQALLLGLSPVHYEPGDMRREYRWTRAALVGAATSLGVALAVRSVLTGLFVAWFSPELSLVTLFNVGLTIAAVGGMAGVAAVRTANLTRFRRREERL